MKNSVALLCGMLFGVGLSLSGMTDPQVVLGFLDLFGAWDPALLLVMMGAVPTAYIGYRWVFKRSHPVFASQFYLPTQQAIDKPLLLGALLFGVGWGLIGLCPGPAIASLAYGRAEIVVFIMSMVMGKLVVGLLAQPVPK